MTVQESAGSGDVVTSGSGAPPLVSFDPHGLATLVSYNLPDPTSFSGRHVLDLDVPFTDFTDVVVDNAGAGKAGGNSIGATTASAAPQVAAADPHAAIIAPASLVINPSNDDTDPVVLSAPYPLSARLASLTWPTIAAMAKTGKRAVIYRSGGGDLDYRVGPAVTIPSPQAEVAGLTGALRASLTTRTEKTTREAARAAPRAPETTTGQGAGTGDPLPSLTIFIDTPARPQPQVQGPAGGVVLQVGGSIKWISVDQPDIAILVDNVKVTSGTLHAGGRWDASVTITASGIHTVQATATAKDDGGKAHTATNSESIVVTLGSTGQGQPPAAVPSVATDLADGTELIAPSGRAVPHLTGSADTNGGSEVSGNVTDSANPGQVFRASVTPDPSGGTKRLWQADVELLTVGSRTLTVACVNADGMKAVSVTRRFTLSTRQLVQPIDRRMYLVETVALSSFRGNYGAGALLKTFSLLPGERAQWSVQSYTKSETTAKSSSSILDSSSSETTSDFEDTLSDEQDLKASSSREQNISVNVEAGGTWGWGHADLKAGYSDKANSSRDDMSKTVSAAVNKHAAKAASNRNVQVNTESSTSTATGVSDDLARTLTNVNVSRVLNFVFRQMTQEHIVLTHLTDFVLGYYTLDVLVDDHGQPLPGPDGQPQIAEHYEEYPLTAINTLLDIALSDAGTRDEVKTSLLNLLSEIADWNGQLTSIVEEVIPTDADGNPAPDRSYLRVARNAAQTYTSGSGATFSVPGIILNAAGVVMPTDAVLVDALLGEGDALDTYSTALQEVTIAERKLGLAERRARLQLQDAALKIITSGDTAAAGLWARVIGKLQAGDDEPAQSAGPAQAPPAP